jgi:Zn ribbon nucleic-acid-binding protein
MRDQVAETGIPCLKCQHPDALQARREMGLQLIVAVKLGHQLPPNIWRHIPPASCCRRKAWFVHDN